MRGATWWQRRSVGEQGAIVTAAVGLVALVALGLAANWSFLFAGKKVYTKYEFEKAFTGKADYEVEKVLGPPDMKATEPWNSPQAGKVGIGYAIDNRDWLIKNHDGGVVLYLSADKKKVDAVEYVPRPRREGGGFIFIRW